MTEEIRPIPPIAFAKLVQDHHPVQGGRALYCFKGCGEWPYDCEVTRLTSMVTTLETENKRLTKENADLRYAERRRTDWNYP